MSVQIEAVLTGRVQPFRGDNEPSAIAKCPVAGAVGIGLLGIEGDEQADQVHHGGPDKAIHHYPNDHYAHWREELGSHPLLDHFGAFGENIATSGLIESDVCIGDRFRLGTALVEVSQGRQPCWKLGHRFGNARVTARVVSTGRAGWYYRVIEPGTVRAGNMLELVARPFPQWTVELVFLMLIGGMAKRNVALTAELSELDGLAAGWRARAKALA